MSPIKLPKKPKPSNKAQITTKFNNNDNDDHIYPEPFIDKISILYSPSAGPLAHEAFNHFWAFKDEYEHFVAAGAPPMGGYSHARRIVIEKLKPKRWPLLHINANASLKEITRLRLEFVPHDLGLHGVINLNSSLLLFLPGGWGQFIAHGRISRIDIAVDIPGVTMDSIWLLPKKAGGTHHWRSNKGIETIKWGKRNGNETMVYSRKAKREAQNQEWDKIADVRIERRLRQQKRQVSDLKSMPNPFEGIVISPNIPGPPELKPSSEYIWPLFTDAVKVRGLVPALNLLPANRKAQFRKHIKDNGFEWWKPEEIWKGWVPMLNELKILDYQTDWYKH